MRNNRIALIPRETITDLELIFLNFKIIKLLEDYGAPYTCYHYDKDDVDYVSISYRVRDWLGIKLVKIAKPHIQLEGYLITGEGKLDLKTKVSLKIHTHIEKKYEYFKLDIPKFVDLDTQIGQYIVTNTFTSTEIFYGDFKGLLKFKDKIKVQNFLINKHSFLKFIDRCENYLKESGYEEEV